MQPCHWASACQDARHQFLRSCSDCAHSAWGPENLQRERARSVGEVYAFFWLYSVAVVSLAMLISACFSRAKASPKLHVGVQKGEDVPRKHGEAGGRRSPRCRLLERHQKRERDPIEREIPEREIPERERDPVGLKN